MRLSNPLVCRFSPSASPQGKPQTHGLHIGTYATLFHGVTYTLIIPAVVPCVVVEAINLMLITRGTS